MITRIITSGAYVDSELQAEFGHVPPCFLPIGGSLLISRQVEMLSGDGVRLALTVPDDFTAGDNVLAALEARGVSVVRVPPKISLGESVALALATLDVQGTVEIVHGDTLIAVPDQDVADGMAVAEVADGYVWAHVRVEDGRIAEIIDSEPDGIDPPPMILTGFFRFADAAGLLRALIRARHRFVPALDAYCRSRPVTALPSPEWLDLGHLQTYFRSRHKLASARHFNSLRIADGLALKTSSDAFKIDAEASWLAGLPPAMQIYGARLIDRGGDDSGAFYSTEYAFLPTLAEISLSYLSPAGWQPIVDAIDRYLSLARDAQGPGDTEALHTLAIAKLEARVARHPEAYPDFDRPLRINGREMAPGREIVANLAREIAAFPVMPVAVMHGDLCFSNIFYNSRTTRISVIDPRGYVRDGVKQMAGDLRYDLAKLAHSALGGYDRIIAGQFDYGRDGDDIAFKLSESTDAVARLFLAGEFAGVGLARRDVLATMISLFFSMIPLHADHPARQRAFYANALALYGRYFGDNA